MVIPAYNEGTVLDRCLRALSGADAQVVVVANGCVDDTAARARAHGVNVVELTTASKIAALNAGDAACGDLFPRIYLDADVVLTAGDAEELARYLAKQDEPMVCAAAPELDLEGASRAVRMFYRAYARMPYLDGAMVGSGLYAVNAAARARWQQFPDLMADDFFVQALFSEQERAVVPSTNFTITAPRTVRGLLRVRTRIYRGNKEAQQRGYGGSMADSRQSSIRSLLSLSRREPAMIGPVAVYLALNIVAMLRAATGKQGRWLTDTSSRPSTVPSD